MLCEGAFGDENSGNTSNLFQAQTTPSKPRHVNVNKPMSNQVRQEQNTTLSPRKRPHEGQEAQLRPGTRVRTGSVDQSTTVLQHSLNIDTAIREQHFQPQSSPRANNSTPQIIQTLQKHGSANLPRPARTPLSERRAARRASLGHSSPASYSRLNQPRGPPSASTPRQVSRTNNLTQSNVSGNTRKKKAVFKILVMGNSKCGKTSFIRRYADGRFDSSYNITVGADYSKKVITTATHQIRLQLWDIAGQDRFAHLTRPFYQNAKAAVILCDVTRPTTLQAVSNWKSDLDRKFEGRE